MQTNCDIFECKEEINSLNYCSDGFIVDLSAFNGENVFCYIKVAGKEFCQSIRVENNIAKVSWKPSEYLPKGIYSVEITFKDSDREKIQVVASDCQLYCGFDVTILSTCETGYKYLNEKCGVNLPEDTLPTNITCTWSLIEKNCNWVLKQNAMIIVIYNGKQIRLNNSPKDGAFVNDLFLDELDIIEDNAFSVSLDGANIDITYVGLADVDILIGCNKIEKICQ
jgi:hypothetical protein